jgi:hypothetical protein
MVAAQQALTERLARVMLHPAFAVEVDVRLSLTKEDLRYERQLERHESEVTRRESAVALEIRRKLLEEIAKRGHFDRLPEGEDLERLLREHLDVDRLPELNRLLPFLLEIELRVPIHVHARVDHELAHVALFASNAPQRP